MNWETWMNYFIQIIWCYTFNNLKHYWKLKTDLVMKNTIKVYNESMSSTLFITSDNYRRTFLPGGKSQVRAGLVPILPYLWNTSKKWVCFFLSSKTKWEFLHKTTVKTELVDWWDALIIVSKITQIKKWDWKNEDQCNVNINNENNKHYGKVHVKDSFSN